jgi:hypothetical protein
VFLCCLSDFCLPKVVSNPNNRIYQDSILLFSKAALRNYIEPRGLNPRNIEPRGLSPEH